MKLSLRYFILISLLINGSTKAQVPSQNKKPLLHPQPLGFVYVAKIKQSNFKNVTYNPSFYLNAQPVSQKDYALFIEELQNDGKKDEAGIALSSINSNPDKQSHSSVLLVSDKAIIVYADWLCKKLSTKKVRAYCWLITDSQWRQAFETEEPLKVNSKKGLIPSQGNEWVVKNGKSILLNNAGEQVSSGTEGYFRLGLNFFIIP